MASEWHVAPNCCATALTVNSLSHPQSNKESFQVPLRKELQNVTEAEKPHDPRALDRLHI